MSKKSLEESVYKYLNIIADRGVKPGLERMKEALVYLGQPQKSYPIIHIAGTNGKGSSCYYIAQMLRLSGYKVGLALSPHVDDYRERVQITNHNLTRLELISSQDLITVHEDLMARLPQDHQLTYFEWGILLALVYFQKQKVDFVVLETGLGGRWDATNVIEKSVVSGVTSVGMDHTEFLGDTLEKIFNEKIQIVKPNSDCVLGGLPQSLEKKAQKFCAEKNTACHLAFKEETSIYSSYDFALRVLKILEKNGVQPCYDLFSKDLLKTLPARLETMSQCPYIIRDGAHNEPALRRLKAYLKERFNDDYDLIFGCLKSRDFLALAKIIMSKGNIYWAKFDGGIRTTTDNIYEQVLQKYGGEIVLLDAAFKNRLKNQEQKRPIVVCGSFYLCAEFKNMWLCPVPFTGTGRGENL